MKMQLTENVGCIFTIKIFLALLQIGAVAIDD